jgi:hypothetical protein
MADQEIHDHQPDIEFEAGRFSENPLHLAQRHELEVGNLAVMVLRHEIGRQFQIIDEDRVVAQAGIELHTVAQRPAGPRPARQFLRHRGLFRRLLDEIVEWLHAGRQAAGHQVVELVGLDRPVGGAAADPKPGFAIAPDIAVDMHAIGLDAEERYRRTFEVE